MFSIDSRAIPTSILLIIATIAVLLMAGVTYAEIPDADIAPDNHGGMMAVEVAEDANRFAFDDLNLFDDGMPAYGSPFVTQGYIYEAGTLNGSNGVLADGSAEFPEQVLGEWTCYGWMIGDGARTESGIWVVSTQVFEFEDGSTVVSDGFEIVDFNVPFDRAITGGTGEYANHTGVQTQTLLGFTDSMGVNIAVAFDFADE